MPSVYLNGSCRSKVIVRTHIQTEPIAVPRSQSDRLQWMRRRKY